MEIIKTTDYFNLTVEELEYIKEGNKSCGYTKEENLILDDGTVIHWYKELTDFNYILELEE